MARAVTRAIAIAAPPARVFALVSDPTTMPRYAPGFARSVKPEGTGWIAETARGTLRVERTLDAGAGTADFRLRSADGRENALFTRVVPIGTGSELVFTLQLPGLASDADAAAQGEILEQELAALKALCESPPA